MTERKRFSARPLLVAGTGLAFITLGAIGGFACGNLIAPRCDEDAGQRDPNCFEPIDAGSDAGTDGGRDGGTDGGDGG